MKRYVIYIIILFTSGCSFLPDRFDDNILITERDSPSHYNIEKAWSKGNSLHIEIDTLPGLNIVTLTPIIFDDAIYIRHSAISTGGGHRVEFILDLSTYNLPSNWQDKIYWLDELFYKFPFLNTPYKMRRVKINVEQT